MRMSVYVFLSDCYCACFLSVSVFCHCVVRICYVALYLTSKKSFPYSTFSRLRLFTCMNRVICVSMLWYIHPRTRILLVFTYQLIHLIRSFWSTPIAHERVQVNG